MSEYGVGFDIRESISKILEVDFNELDNYIATLRSQSEGYGHLGDLENKYLIEASERFGAERSWESVEDKYFKYIRMKIGEQPTQNEARIWIRQEFLRFTLAKFLQLNKFTASWDEIKLRFGEYGLDLKGFDRSILE